MNEDIFGAPVEWKETMRTPSFFGLDGHVVSALPLFLIHMRWWTLGVLILTFVFFMLLRIFRYRPSSAIRLIRSACAGSNRPARHYSKARRAVDYSFEQDRAMW